MFSETTVAWVLLGILLAVYGGMTAALAIKERKYLDEEIDEVLEQAEQDCCCHECCGCMCCIDEVNECNCCECVEECSCGCECECHKH